MQLWPTALFQRLGRLNPQSAPIGAHAVEIWRTRVQTPACLFKTVQSLMKKVARNCTLGVPLEFLASRVASVALSARFGACPVPVGLPFHVHMCRRVSAAISKLHDTHSGGQSRHNAQLEARKILDDWLLAGCLHVFDSILGIDIGVYLFEEQLLHPPHWIPQVLPFLSSLRQTFCP